MIEISQQIFKEISANYPALAEIAKFVPAIPWLQTVVAHIKGRIFATIKPQNSQRVVDDNTGMLVTIIPGEETSVTWPCPLHQSSHTIFINHKSANFAEVSGAGRSIGVLSPVSKSLAISPDVFLEWVE